ncbi:MAG TPA: transcription-repair coupling factor [Anaerolineales bacterium]|nr:transcription-repair coupling factor [Anaerolineales bacterium]
MRLDQLIERIAATAQDAFSTLLASKDPGFASGVEIEKIGLRRAARLPVLAALYATLQKPILLLTERADLALTLMDELALWLPVAPRLHFPEPNPLFYEKEPWGENTRRDRLMVLTRLAAYHIPNAAVGPAEIIIASARALMARTLPRRDFLKATRSIRPVQVIQPNELIHSWVSLGYQVVNTVITPGQFARRGGLLDIWPPAELHPTRIEFFGDEIETLRYFDPTSQRTFEIHERLLISPAREFTLPSGGEHDIEELHEFHLPLLHKQIASLLDYLPRQALVLIDDLQAIREAWNEVEEQAIAIRGEQVAEGNLAEDFPLPYLTWSELLDTLPRHTVLELGPSGNLESSLLAEWFQPGPRFGGRLKPFIEHLVERIERGEQVIVVSRQSTRLQELWSEQNASPDSRGPAFIQGSLAEGWSFAPPTGEVIHLFSDGEIFGWRRPEPRQRPRPVAEAPEAPYTDLQAGDYVVHVDHGVGCFIGLVSRTIEGNEREYLCIEYADEAQLFVPVHQADRVTRYVGPDGRPPALSRLGSPEWRSVKSHVKEAVQEVAEDLLELYAWRSVIHGHAFEKDTTWQHELEASFPYIETEDQARVIQEVKEDMERPRPMDRLICGDVGYGKTEVALRAAFKAVMDGKQVAMLVPTTVLAQQHYQTFRQRLAAFPVEVEMLSRFRNQQQQREIIARLAAGAIDIVIGTHRLLSADVEFKDLGLLIIDEEQRFGVTHKEKLKKLRTEVDVLTMTATPIPRTLYMALTGVRDISTINTPPEERLPIVTHVGPYSPRLVRQAILRELERGGQVFFVHNRVQTIGAMRNHLAQLIPEARLAIAHGQMAESDLSERMKQFTNGEVDVLLSTSIIESGLDIPNANTLIVDRADTFGLAQLYQLRGRVGRGAQRAYSYFFRHTKRLPTLDGRQRLETIAENTQLGSGFSIAMRDMEIRGAGDILGTRQHGHIAAVGFYLYTRLLAEAVGRIQPRGMALLTGVKRPLPPASPVNVDLPLHAGIPADYVTEKTMRLRLYRRLADIQSIQELEAIAEEFKDRFGPLPAGVNNLIYQLQVKILAQKAGIESITSENGQMVLRFSDSAPPEALPNLGPLVRVGKTALWIPMREIPAWQEFLVAVLERIGAELASKPADREPQEQRAA